MDFSNIARQLNEGTEAVDAAASSAEKAVQGGATQKEDTNRRKNSQKAHMAQQGSVVRKSDVSYASEDYRLERERASAMQASKSDWRKELIEAAEPDAEGNHPYVSVMPFISQKEDELKRQMKAAATKQAGDKMAQQANESAAMDFMRNKYKGALMSDSETKGTPKPPSKEEANERARRRAKFAKKEHDRLYGRKND